MRMQHASNTPGTEAGQPLEVKSFTYSGSTVDTQGEVGLEKGGGWRGGGGQVHMWEQKQAKHKLLSWFKRKFRAPGRLENPPRGQYSTQMWSQYSFVVLKHGEWFKQHSISSRLSSTAVCTKSTPYPVAREDTKPGPVKDSKAKTSGCTCQ